MADEGFDSVAVVIIHGGGIAKVCENWDVADAWVRDNGGYDVYWVHVHPVEHRRNKREKTDV